MVIACHWKSKSEGAEVTEEARRESAALVRGLIVARIAADPAAEIVVCGDLNESPDEYVRAGKRYATALMPVEEIEARRRPMGRNRIAAGAPARRVDRGARGTLRGRDLSSTVPGPSRAATAIPFGAAAIGIDNFLLSPGLLDASGLSYRSFSAVKADFLVDGEGNPIAWPGSGSTGYSDHLPILLVLGIREGRILAFPRP